MCCNVVLASFICLIIGIAPPSFRLSPSGLGVPSGAQPTDENVMPEQILNEIEVLFLQFDETKNSLIELAKRIKEHPELPVEFDAKMHENLSSISRAVFMFKDSIHIVIDALDTL